MWCRESVMCVGVQCEKTCVFCHIFCSEEHFFIKKIPRLKILLTVLGLSPSSQSSPALCILGITPMVNRIFACLAFRCLTGSRPDSDSQEGFVVGLARKQPLVGEESPIIFVAWCRKRLGRISRSSLNLKAQANACADRVGENVARALYGATKKSS